MFKIGSQVVAVGRLVFNEHHTEAERTSLVDLPEYIKKSSFIEAEICLIQNLGWEFISFTHSANYEGSLENNISWVVSIANSLVNIYLRFGVRPRKESFATSFMEEKRLNLLISNVRHLFLCKVFLYYLFNYISRYI